MAGEAIGPTKTCSKCGEEKPRDLVHFAVANRRKDRIGPECRPCNVARKRAEKRRLKEREPERVHPPGRSRDPESARPLLLLLRSAIDALRRRSLDSAHSWRLQSS